MTKHIGMLVKNTQKVVPLKNIAVNIELQDLMANVEIKQQYSNVEDSPIEIVYTFPLASEAVLLDLSIQLDGKVLKGSISPKYQAMESYEEAVGEGNTAVLLEKLEGGLYSLSLGNLLPGKNVSIGLKYSQLYQWQGNDLRFLLPTVIAPRYGVNHLDAHQQPIINSDVEHRYSLNMKITGLLTDAQINCPSHTVQSQLIGNTVTLQFTEETSLLDRDLVINFKLHGGDKACAFYDVDGDKFSAIASFKPTADASIDISTFPKNVKILLDCSGSMLGDSIEQAREAILLALKELREIDYISIVRFGSTVSPFTEGLIPATKDNIKVLSAEVDNIHADLGGTEIFSALHFALDQAVSISNESNKRSSDIFLITDGEVWNNGESDSIVEKARSTSQRIFTVGVGSAVSENFVRELAKSTLGTVEFASPNEAMTEKIVRHFQRIFAPVLRNVRVKWPAHESWSYQPEQLFIGDTYISYAQLDDMSSGNVVLSASWPDGSAYHQTVEVRYLNSLDVDIERKSDSLIEGQVLQSNTARLVANQQKSQCIDADEIVAIAVKYQLMDKSASYIMVEENIEKPEHLPELRQVDQMVAAGWAGTGSVKKLSKSVASRSRKKRALDTASFVEMERSEKAVPASPASIESSLDICAESDAPFLDEFSEAGSYLTCKESLEPPCDVSSSDFIRICIEKYLTAERLTSLTIDDLLLLGLPEQIVEQLRGLVSSSLNQNEISLGFLEQLTRKYLAEINGSKFLRLIVKSRKKKPSENMKSVYDDILKSWED